MQVVILSGAVWIIMKNKDLRKYVNSLKKSELQVQLYDALVELEEIRDRYW